MPPEVPTFPRELGRLDRFIVWGLVGPAGLGREARDQPLPGLPSRGERCPNRNGEPKCRLPNHHILPSFRRHSSLFAAGRGKCLGRLGPRRRSTERAIFAALRARANTSLSESPVISAGLRALVESGPGEGPIHRGL